MTKTDRFEPDNFLAMSYTGLLRQKLVTTYIDSDENIWESILLIVNFLIAQTILDNF